MASDINPDLILVTESWCNPDRTNAYLTIPGFELQTDLRVDRSDTGGGRGGGFLVYSKTRLQILKLDQSTNLTQVCKFKLHDMTCYLVYRPPSAGADSVSELVNILKNCEKNSILIGDFNLPAIDWEAGTGRGKAVPLLEAAEDALTEQLITFPTQVRGNILDLELTNIPERISEVTEAGRLGNSDHTIITTKVKFGEVTVEGKDPQPNWRKADWDRLRRELAGGILSEGLTGSVEETWTSIKNTVREAVKGFVPLIRPRNNNRPPWLSQPILCEIRKKKRMWKSLKIGGSAEEYRAQEKKVKNMIQNAKISFEEKKNWPVENKTATGPFSLM
jgi:hypothetical protein